MDIEKERNDQRVMRYFCDLYNNAVAYIECLVCSVDNNAFGECKHIRELGNINRCPICGINYLHYRNDEMCIQCQEKDI